MLECTGRHREAITNGDNNELSRLKKDIEQELEKLNEGLDEDFQRVNMAIDEERDAREKDMTALRQEIADQLSVIRHFIEEHARETKTSINTASVKTEVKSESHVGFETLHKTHKDIAELSNLAAAKSDALHARVDELQMIVDRLQGPSFGSIPASAMEARPAQATVLAQAPMHTMEGRVGALEGEVAILRDSVDGFAAEHGVLATHKVTVAVDKLFGQERSLGLRIDERVVTRFTEPEAEACGWKVGDIIIGVGNSLVCSQASVLSQIVASKVELERSGTPISFLVERFGQKQMVQSF